MSRVAAPADITERQPPLREASERVGFDGGGIETLFGDAVAEKNNAIAIPNQEFRGQRARREQGGGEAFAAAGVTLDPLFTASSLGIKR